MALKKQPYQPKTKQQIKAESKVTDAKVADAQAWVQSINLRRDSKGRNMIKAVKDVKQLLS